MAVNELFFERFPDSILEYQIQVRPYNALKTRNMRSLNPEGALVIHQMNAHVKYCMPYLVWVYHRVLCAFLSPQTSISWSPSAAWWSAPRSSFPRCRRPSSSARCAPSPHGRRWIVAGLPSQPCVATATPPTAWRSFTIAHSFPTNRWWEFDGARILGRLLTIIDAYSQKRVRW